MKLNFLYLCKINLLGSASGQRLVDCIARTIGFICVFCVCTVSFRATLSSFFPSVVCFIEL